MLCILRYPLQPLLPRQSAFLVRVHRTPDMSGSSRKYPRFIARLLRPTGHDMSHQMGKLQAFPQSPIAPLHHLPLHFLPLYLLFLQLERHQVNGKITNSGPEDLDLNLAKPLIGCMALQHLTHLCLIFLSAKWGL